MCVREGRENIRDARIDASRIDFYELVGSPVRGTRAGGRRGSCLESRKAGAESNFRARRRFLLADEFGESSDPSPNKPARPDSWKRREARIRLVSRKTPTLRVNRRKIRVRRERGKRRKRRREDRIARDDNLKVAARVIRKVRLSRREGGCEPLTSFSSSVASADEDPLALGFSSKGDPYTRA